MTEKRFATRYVLPLEMVVAVQLLGLAAAGSWPESALYNVLALTRQNTIWTMVLGAVGMTGLWLALLEWMCGRGWCNQQLRIALTARKWVSFFAFFAWTFALFTMISAPEGWRVVEIQLESVPLAAFALWSWWVNSRAEIVLDPTISTTRLERLLETKRSSW